MWAGHGNTWTSMGPSERCHWPESQQCDWAMLEQWWPPRYQQSVLGEIILMQHKSTMRISASVQNQGSVLMIGGHMGVYHEQLKS